MNKILPVCCNSTLNPIINGKKKYFRFRISLDFLPLIHQTFNIIVLFLFLLCFALHVLLHIHLRRLSNSFEINGSRLVPDCCASSCVVFLILERCKTLEDLTSIENWTHVITAICFHILLEGYSVSVWASEGISGVTKMLENRRSVG